MAVQRAHQAQLTTHYTKRMLANIERAMASCYIGPLVDDHTGMLLDALAEYFWSHEDNPHKDEIGDEGAEWVSARVNEALSNLARAVMSTMEDGAV